jgi:hypothetical protein
LNRVNPGGAELPSQIHKLFLLPQGKCVTAGAGISVHFQNFSRFGVFQDEPAQGGQFQFVTVGDLHRYDVMPPVGDPQRGLLSLGQNGRRCR